MRNEIEMASENAQQLLSKAANSQTVNAVANVAGNTVKKIMNNSTSIGAGLAMGVIGTAAGLMISGYASGNPLQDANAETIVQETQKNPPLDFGSTPPPEMVPNHNGGYIININGDTRKGNRQLKSNNETCNINNSRYRKPLRCFLYWWYKSRSIIWRSCSNHKSIFKKRF